MIHLVFEALAGELNRVLKSKHNITEDKVVPSSIMNPDGGIAVQEPDKIIMSLSNIEQDRTQSSNSTYRKTKRGYMKEKAAVNINLTIVFSSYFTSENYLEGLKFITSVIAFFQSHNGSFTPQNVPALNEVVERITVELINLDARDLNNLWGPMGAKYMPSVVYRVRTLPIKHDLPGIPIPMVVKT